MRNMPVFRLGSLTTVDLSFSKLLRNVDSATMSPKDKVGAFDTNNNFARNLELMHGRPRSDPTTNNRLRSDSMGSASSYAFTESSHATATNSDQDLGSDSDITITRTDSPTSSDQSDHVRKAVQRRRSAPSRIAASKARDKATADRTGGNGQLSAPTVRRSNSSKGRGEAILSECKDNNIDKQNGGADDVSDKDEVERRSSESSVSAEKRLAADEDMRSRKISCPEFVKKPTPNDNTVRKANIKKLPLQETTFKYDRKLSPGEGVHTKKGLERSKTAPLFTSEPIPIGDKNKSRWTILRNKFWKGDKKSPTDIFSPSTDDAFEIPDSPAVEKSKRSRRISFKKDKSPFEEKSPRIRNFESTPTDKPSTSKSMDISSDGKSFTRTSSNTSEMSKSSIDEADVEEPQVR